MKFSLTHDAFCFSFTKTGIFLFAIFWKLIHCTTDFSVYRTIQEFTLKCAGTIQERVLFKENTTVC